MNLEMYTFEDGDGHTVEFTTQNFQEAKEYAITHSLKLIANTYEFSDSEVLADYTPPKKRRRPRRKK
jgi:hypothetical protein